MAEESDFGIGDYVAAEIIECDPPEPVVEETPIEDVKEDEVNG